MSQGHVFAFKNVSVISGEASKLEGTILDVLFTLNIIEKIFYFYLYLGSGNKISSNLNSYFITSLIYQKLLVKKSVSYLLVKAQFASLNSFITNDCRCSANSGYFDRVFSIFFRPSPRRMCLSRAKTHVKTKILNKLQYYSYFVAL